MESMPIICLCVHYELCDSLVDICCCNIIYSFFFMLAYLVSYLLCVIFYMIMCYMKADDNIDGGA